MFCHKKHHHWTTFKHSKQHEKFNFTRNFMFEHGLRYSQKKNNLKVVIWAAHSYHVNLRILKKKMIGIYKLFRRNITTPVKCMQTSLKICGAYGAMRGGRARISSMARKILFYISSHNFFFPRDTAWQGSISYSWEQCA